jgi:hypothetical protein
MAKRALVKLETTVWAAMRSHEGRGVLAIAKKVTLNQNLMVLGCLRDQIRIMPDYPLRRFLPDFGPRPSSWGFFLELTDFQVPCSSKRLLGPFYVLRISSGKVSDGQRCWGYSRYIRSRA